MGVIKITQSEFRRRLIKDQQHFKRSKLHQEGHTDEEIAIYCNVHKDTIRKWRENSGLDSNLVIKARGYKSKIGSRRPLGRDIQRASFF